MPHFISDVSLSVKVLQIWNIMKHILNGVAFIHSHGEVHRDLKPQNSTYSFILLTLNTVLYSRKNSVWKIADFGLMSQATSVNMHASRQARGTPGYRAPEMLREENSGYNQKVDIWSIGCILYELIMFRKAFESDIDVYHYSQLGASLDILPHGFDKDSTRRLAEHINCMLQNSPSMRPSASSLLVEVIQFSGDKNKPDQFYIKIHDEFRPLLDIPRAGNSIRKGTPTKPNSVNRKRRNHKIFGNVAGVVNGQWWATRIEASRDGCHAPSIAGISGNEKKGCWSIALSGGYEDDVDEGYRFTYTGCGGRGLRDVKQSSDQALTRLNLALKISCDTGNPVRVIRGFKGHPKWAPSRGYRCPVDSTIH